MKVAVIGGGIVGATAAYYLTKKKDDVTIFDNQKGQATSAAAGIISPWLSQRRNQDWYQLARAGAKFYPNLIADLKLETDSDIYRQVGTILFKNNELLLEKLYQLAHLRHQEAPEIGDIRLLTPSELTEKVPILTPKMAGLFVSGGAKVDGRQLIKQLIASFTQLGGHYQGENVVKLNPKGTQWQIETATKSDTFDKVIVAAGAWLPSIIKPLGFKVDIRAQKGQLASLHIEEDTRNWPVIMPQGESDLIPFNNGQILVGATHENEYGYDLTVDKLVIKKLIESLSELAPSLLKAPIQEIRVGTRAYTSDFLPFFGELKELPGLLVASGLGSSGLTTGPLIGYTLAALIHQEQTLLETKRYRPDNYIWATHT